jgi:PAS domain S-box-containing protein
MQSVGNYRNVSWVFMLAILLMAGLLLVWFAHTRESDFINHQLELARHSVNGAAKEIESYIKETHRTVALFADQHRELIRHLVKEPTDTDARDRLEQLVGKHFPDYFAMTIADAHGTPLLGNFELLVNERCEQDIREYVRHGYRSNVYIHPHPEVYHFDIMANLPLSDGHLVVFFVSFRPALLARLLGNAQIHRHELMLLKQDVVGLIEVAGGGARIDLEHLQGQFILTPEQMAEVVYSVPVNGTLWNLVDRPEAKLFQEARVTIWGQTMAMFVVFALISVVMFGFVRREELRRSASEGALQRAKEQLQHAMEFSNVCSWEMDLGDNIFSWSESAKRVFGWNVPADLQDFLQRVHPDYRDLVQERLQACIDSSVSCRLEYPIGTSDKIERWLETTGNLEMSRDGKRKLIGLITDISERKRAEEDRIAAEQAQRETLIREVHHRIKNNLQGVEGLLRQHGARSPDNLDIIETAVGQLRSVSTVYGLQSSHGEGEIMLADLLSEICQATIHMTGSTIVLEAAASETHPTVLNTDKAVAIALILNELVFNAVKHSPAEKLPAINVSLQSQEQNATVTIINHEGRLPEGFDLANPACRGTGLSLIMSLLPKQGANLRIEQQPDGVYAVLILTSPVIKPG